MLWGRQYNIYINLNVYVFFSFGITLHLLLLRIVFLSMLSQLETTDDGYSAVISMKG